MSIRDASVAALPRLLIGIFLTTAWLSSEAQSPSPNSTAREDSVAEQQGDNSMDEQELWRKNSQIDREIKELYLNRDLLKDTEEFDRRKNELLEQKKQLVESMADVYRNKSRVTQTQQTKKFTKEQLSRAKEKADAINRQASAESGGDLSSSSSDTLQTAANRNQKRQQILAKSVKSSQKKSQLSQQPTALPQLGAESTASDRPIISEEALAQQAVTLGETIASGGALLPSMQQVAATGVALGTQVAESWFDQFGKAQIDLQIDDEFRISSYEFDYLMPYYNSKTVSAFMQLGFRNWTGRDILNFGLGYRYFHRGWMFGANAFVDTDLSLGHQRGSLGVEVMNSFVKGYSNAYLPISGWQETDRTLEARAAAGVDVGLEIQVGWVPGLSISTEYFKWFGDHVDMGGSFEQNINPESFHELAENPEGLTLGVEYRPIPLLGVTLEHTVGEDEVRNTTLGLDLTWSFDTALSKQLKTHQTATFDTVESMRESFVERESNIILAYREQGGNTDVTGLTLTLPESHEVVETQSLVITVKVEHSSAISSIEWSGAGITLLDDPNASVTTFTALFWDPVIENNVFPLTITITDALGRVESANTEVTVLEDPQLRPIITFTDDTGQQITSLSLIHADPSFQLNTVIQSQRQSDNNQNPPGQDSYLWEGDTQLLSVDNSPNPEVLTAESINDYEVTLTVTLQDGQTNSASLPVTILPTQGTPLSAGVDEKRDYVEGDFFEQPATGLDGTAVRYKSSNPNVGRVDSAGRVDILSAGTTTIFAIEDAFDNFATDSDNYKLIIEPAHSGLAWHDPRNILDANNKATKTLVDGAFEIEAETSLNESNGAISYRLEGDPQIATVDRYSGRVTIGGSVMGVVNIIANQTPSTNGNYRETEVSYELEVGPIVPTMTWKDAGVEASKKITKVYLDQCTDYTLTVDHNSPGSVTYASPSKYVDVESKTGKVTFITAGHESRITATLEAKDDYDTATTFYDLMVEPASGDPVELLSGTGGIYMGQRVKLKFEGDPGSTFTYDYQKEMIRPSDQEDLWEVRYHGTTTLKAIQQNENYVYKDKEVNLTLHKPKVTLYNMWDPQKYRIELYPSSRYSIFGINQKTPGWQNDNYNSMEVKGLGRLATVEVFADGYLNRSHGVYTVLTSCNQTGTIHVGLEDPHVSGSGCWYSTWNGKNMDVSAITITMESFARD